ncbi:reverse transcriptase domain-containing protein [Tanacetum coccineum]
MPTWCHMFNSTLTGNAKVWFDKLLKESIDSYEDLRTAFRENYLQQTKHIKDPVEIYYIKQRDGESTEDFMERYKAEVLGPVEIAPACMRFPTTLSYKGKLQHSVTVGEKHPHHGNNQRGGDKPNFKKGFKNKQRPDRKPDRFSLLTKTPKEILALEKGKFKAPPPMHRKKEEASGKEKPLTKLMINPNGKEMARAPDYQSISPRRQCTFSTFGEEDGTPPVWPNDHRRAKWSSIYVACLNYIDCVKYPQKSCNEQLLHKTPQRDKGSNGSATTHLIGFSGETMLGHYAIKPCKQE